MSDDFGLFDVFLSMFWFFLLFAWIGLIIRIFSDLFSDRGLSGGAKALWVVFLIFLPWIGALSYIIARGRSMNERSMQRAQESEASFRAYVQDAAASSGGGGGGTAEELRKLAELREKGAITPADYEQAKVKVLS